MNPVKRKEFERPMNAADLEVLLGVDKKFFLINKERLKIPHLKLSKHKVLFYKSEVMKWLEERRVV